MRHGQVRPRLGHIPGDILYPVIFPPLPPREIPHRPLLPSGQGLSRVWPPARPTKQGYRTTNYSDVPHFTFWSGLVVLHNSLPFDRPFPTLCPGLLRLLSGIPVKSGRPNLHHIISEILPSRLAPGAPPIPISRPPGRDIPTAFAFSFATAVAVGRPELSLRRPIPTPPLVLMRSARRRKTLPLAHAALPSSNLPFSTMAHRSISGHTVSWGFSPPIRIKHDESFLMTYRPNVNIWRK